MKDELIELNEKELRSIHGGQQPGMGKGLGGVKANLRAHQNWERLHSMMAARFAPGEGPGWVERDSGGDDPVLGL